MSRAFEYSTNGMERTLIPAVIISKKRDGEKLSGAEIDYMVSEYARGSLPDYQMSALAMAIFLKGMDSEEIAQMTDAMIASGGRLKRVSERPRVDKHSTGGLGDKTSLILAPMLACCELDVPMISGRGLGITGGTLDKLEAIEGYRCDLSEAQIEQQVREIGCVITGATESLVPADRKLYGLRDVTGTVPSIALITSSIMSKKIAETLDALVLDVKWGSGAFLGTIESGTALAKSLWANGERAGIRTTALLSDMNQPLGRMVGNACEVEESLAIMRGEGPREVRELTIELAARLMVEVGRSSAGDPSALENARRVLANHLDTGRVMERFERMVKKQGGRLEVARRLGRSSEFVAEKSGWLGAIDGQKLGQAVIAMGGGRKVAGEKIDPSVGIEMLRRLGDRVERGDVLLRVFCDDDAKKAAAIDFIRGSLQIVQEPVETRPLWRETFFHS